MYIHTSPPLSQNHRAYTLTVTVWFIVDTEKAVEVSYIAVHKYFESFIVVGE